LSIRTRVADLKNATKQLLVNRGDFKDTDVAFLRVFAVKRLSSGAEKPPSGRNPQAVLERSDKFLQHIAVRPACAPNRVHQAQRNRLVVETLKRFWSQAAAFIQLR
jgi:hypothetical protein